MGALQDLGDRHVTRSGLLAMTGILNPIIERLFDNVKKKKDGKILLPGV